MKKHSIRDYEETQKSGAGKSRTRSQKSNRRNIVLLVLLAVFLSPAVLGMGSGAIAVVSTLFALIAMAVLGIGFLTVAACFGTVILTVMGAEF